MMLKMLACNEANEAKMLTVIVSFECLFVLTIFMLKKKIKRTKSSLVEVFLILFIFWPHFSMSTQK